MKIRRRSGASVDHGRWNEKRRIVEESLEEGASIAEVARRHDLNANQLFTWRRQFGVEPAEPKELAPILPVTIAPDTTAEVFRSRVERPDGDRSRRRAIGSSCGLMSRRRRCRGS